MVYVYMLLYLSIIIVVLTNELKREKKILVDTITFFNIYFVIFYGVAPLLKIIINIIQENRIEELYLQKIEIPLIILMFYGFFIMGTKIKFFNIIVEEKNKKTNFFITLQIILVIMIYIYTIGYDGLFNAIGNASEIRRGNMINYNKFAFVKRFFTIQFILVGIFYVLKKNQKKFRKYFFMALISSVTVALLLAGRINFLYFTVIIFFTYLKLHREKKNNNRINKKVSSKIIKIIFIVGFGIFFKFLVLNGKRAVNSFKYLLEGNILEYRSLVIGDKALVTNSKKFIENFSHTVTSIDAALNTTIEPIYFLDLLNATIDLIPGVDTGHRSIAYINTYNILGVFESNIPPGMIGFVIYYFGIIGIPMIGLIYGNIWRSINIIFQKLIKTDKVYYPIMLYFSWNLANGIYTSDIRVDISKTFPILVFLGIVFYKRKIKIKLR